MKRNIISLAVVAVFATGCSSMGAKKEEAPKPVVKVVAPVPEPVIKVENKLEQKPDIKKAEAEFVESNGSLQLQFSEEGDWVVIKTMGTAPINFNHSQGHEDAFMLASMRAKRNLIEFLNNDIKSNKAVDNLTKTSLRDIVSTKNKEQREPNAKEDDESGAGIDTFNEEDRRRANRISQTVSESIRDSSQGILKGAFIAKRAIDRETNMVTVTLMVSKKSINTSNDVRKMMNGF
jgi:hypothetical protein